MSVNKMSKIDLTKTAPETIDQLLNDPEWILKEGIRTAQYTTKVELQLRKGSMGWWRNPASSEEKTILLTEVFKRLSPSDKEIEVAKALSTVTPESPQERKARLEKDAEVSKRHNTPEKLLIRYWDQSAADSHSKEEVDNLLTKMSPEELKALLSKVYSLPIRDKTGIISYITAKVLERQPPPTPEPQNKAGLFARLLHSVNKGER
jgi:hypothetical protein